jgi:hypothetical protein
MEPSLCGRCWRGCRLLRSIIRFRKAAENEVVWRFALVFLDYAFGTFDDEQVNS